MSVLFTDLSSTFLPWTQEHNIQLLFGNSAIIPLIIACSATNSCAMKSPTRAVNLRCEFVENPIGIDAIRPRLSWQQEDTRRGARQTAWQIRAASSADMLPDHADLWDSGRIAGDSCLDIEYAGTPLSSRRQVWWMVRIWDHRGNASEWSTPASFETGLLSATDWTAAWIGKPIENREGSLPCPYLRRDFTLRDTPVRARLYVTARGMFEIRINGIKVGIDLLAPGWTNFNKRIHTLTYDVSSMLCAGANAAGAILGDGWYAGILSRSAYGRQLSLLFQLEAEYADGSRDVICGGPDWKTSFGPLRESDIYNGETYDARLDLGKWSEPGYDDSSWEPAAVFEPPAAILQAKPNLPIRRQEELPVIAQTEPQFGVHVFDLGQNMVGWARIRVRGQSGDTVRIRFAEMLNADGTLYTDNLRTARATDFFICRGGAEEVYEPTFTFHGFRYVELTGLREKPLPTDVTGVVVHSELPLTGSFECSDELVNRLQKNIAWGQKGNFLDVPTDCPQRNERYGWTGDAQVFCRTAAWNRDVATFFEKWGDDLADAQLPGGEFTHIAPNVFSQQDGGCAAWADAGVICPWEIYLAYGNKRILERQYSSMVKWIEWQKTHSRNLIGNFACFGDWLAIDIAENDAGRSPTPRDLISTAYFAHSTRIVGKIAALLGRRADARRYAALADRVHQALNREFVTPAGRVAGDTQTGYLLALAFDLLPPARRAYAVQRLVGDIEGRGWKLSTGFVGTPLLAPVLSRFGRSDVAYRLLLQREYPSWLYTVLQGGTTMWERWNSYTKEKGFGDVGMNSFNHYAYGAIGEWMYATVAGIDRDPDCPAYKHVIFRPQPGKGVTRASGELLTRYGRTSCAWHVEGNRMKVRMELPPNTTGTALLPGWNSPKKITAGIHSFTVSLRQIKDTALA